MSGGVDTHRLHRALTTLSFGAVDHYEAKKRRQFENGLDEIWEEFQIEVSGQFTGTVGSAQLDLNFQVMFVDGRENTDRVFYLPQFNQGFVQHIGPPGLLIASVAGYKMDDKETITGALVNVICCRPGFPNATPFGGILNLTFRGYGAPALDEDELEID